MENKQVGKWLIKISPQVKKFVKYKFRHYLKWENKMDYTNNNFDVIFYEKFGNEWYQKIKRKFYYTKEENLFISTIIGGSSKNRPKWDIRITD